MFLTSKSNKGRKDILCPIGCRAIHKKKQNEIRSKKYRETIMGKKKKKKLNEKRYRIQDQDIKRNDKDLMEDDDFKDPENNTFYGYLWFLFKITFFNPDNPGLLYRLYKKIKKIFKK
jgi:hypothetical protein